MARLAFASAVTTFLYFADRGAEPPQGAAPLQTLNNGSDTFGLGNLLAILNTAVSAQGVAPLQTINDGPGTLLAVSNRTVPPEGVAPLQTLNDGNMMPTLGLGTLVGLNNLGDLVKADENQLVRAVEIAIDAGYRLFDTAFLYESEDQVGQGVKNKIEDGTVKRKDIYVVTKLWNNQHARSEVVPSLRESLQKLAMDYVDLYLIHWPVAYTKNRTIQNIDYLETWQGMEDAKRLGLAKSIGIANFNEQQIDRLFNNSEIKPAVLQVEVNLNLSQRKLLAHARAKGLVVMAYTPFGALVPYRATPDTPPPKLDDPAMVKIAKRLGKTVPQVVLRYLLDKGVTPIPKAFTPSHIIENIDVFDIQLLPEDTALMDSYNRDYRIIRPDFFEHHPDYPFEKIH